jgi:tetratricopeptide (TPR) repeat protein
MVGGKPTLALFALLSVSCTTWVLSFPDTNGTACGTVQYARTWETCSGRCDAALRALADKNDTEAAGEKLTLALEHVDGDKALAAEIRFDRALVHEARGEWQSALDDLDEVVRLDPRPEFADERVFVRRRIGLPAADTVEGHPPPSFDAYTYESCGCFTGQTREPPHEYALATVIEPGKGVGPIQLEESTLASVLRVYGCDCRVWRDRATREVAMVDYNYTDASGDPAAYRPKRTPNGTRPALFEIHDGHVARIGVSNLQTALSTADGVRVSSTRADVVRIFGDGFRLLRLHGIEKYRYEDRGVEVWLPKDGTAIESIWLFKP